MDFYLDAAYLSLNKFGEELCGDKVEIIRNNDGIIIVLADGLGSGVKANILATLTSKIAGTMLVNGANIYETVDTIMHTLPVCSVRKLAYSTFSILQIKYDGTLYAVEYDNPPYFIIRDGNLLNIKREYDIVNEKKIGESMVKLEKGDTLVLTSDGVVHAGVGQMLRLGWQHKNVVKYSTYINGRCETAKDLANNIMGMCKKMYKDKPGDDTTAVVIKISDEKVVDLFTGPPKDKKNDIFIVNKLLESKGKKIVCGGTAARIVERITGERIIVDILSMTENIPPIATIEGIDLVTEGVLTLTKAVEKIKKYSKEPENIKKDFFSGKDGATRLADILINDCTCLNLWVGKAVNPAHQNPDLPVDLSIKLKVVEFLAEIMKSIGKEVNINYIE